MSDEPENEKAYGMWLEESDPEDADYNGSDESSEKESSDGEKDKDSEEFSDAVSIGTENERTREGSLSDRSVENEERKSLKRKKKCQEDSNSEGLVENKVRITRQTKKKGKKQKKKCPEVSSSDGSVEDEGRKRQKRKKKCKKQKNECLEDSSSEDRMTEERKKDEEMERFEYEVEDSVAGFVDEIRIGRNTIPDSSDSDEDPIVLRDRRVRQRRSDRLSIGIAFLTGVEFKEAGTPRVTTL